MKLSGTHKSHAAHNTGNNRTPSQAESRAMVHNVIRARFGERWLAWLCSAVALGGVEKLPSQQRIDIVK